MMVVSLFPLKPLGIGTAEIESLSSYIHRLAFEHGVYVGELLHFLHKHGMREGIISNVDKLASYATVADFVRPTKATSTICKLLEHFTGYNLSQNKLWVLECALGRSSGEVVSGFRWCPECFSEMMSIGCQPYFKLIWHMAAISACPIHRVPLSNKCEFCGCNQVSYKKVRSLGYCQNCGKSLSKRNKRLRASDIKMSWQDIGWDVVHLFSDLAKVEPGSLSAGGAKKSVDDLFDYYWRKGCEEVLYQSLTRDKILAIVYEQSSISLKSARRIAYRLGLSLFDLLSGNATQTTDVLDHSQFCSLPPGYLDATQKTKRDHRSVLNRAKRALRETDEPPSLKALARKLEVSVGYLEYRHPILVQDIVVRYIAHRERQRLKAIYEAQRSALDFFLAEKYATVPHSRKQAYRTLRAETGLPKHMLRRAVQAAYQAIYI